MTRPETLFTAIVALDLGGFPPSAVGQDGPSCSRAESSLAAKPTGRDYCAAIAQIVWCGDAGPRALAAQWLTPPTDTTALRVLAGASARISDPRLLAAAKGVLLGRSRSRDVRLAAIQVLVGQFDPALVVEYRTPSGPAAAWGGSYVMLGHWIRESGFPGASGGERGDSVPPATRGLVVSLLRQVGASDPDDVVQKVTSYLAERLAAADRGR